MGTTAQKLEYLGTTKSQLKDMINYGLDENKITSSTTFRNYVSSIKEAFLEALRTPDTLFTNLPKKSGSGSNISLNDTANAPMRITLSASELTQASTPTPSSPQDIHTISGSNKIRVKNANVLNPNTFVSSTYITGIDNNTSVITFTPNSTFIVPTIFDNMNLEAGEYTIYCEVLTGAYTGGNMLLYDKNNTKYTEWAFKNSDTHIFNLSATNGLKTIKLWNPINDVITTIKLWIAKGTYTSTTMPTYEPYISQEAEIDLKSKNIFKGYDYNITDYATVQGIKCVKNDDGTYTLNGTSTGNGYIEILYKFGSGTTGQSDIHLPLDNTKSYTMSFNILSGTTTDASNTLFKADSYTLTLGSSVSITNSSGLYRAYFQYTTGIIMTNLRVGIQIQEGARTKYIPYYDYGNYSKIGNYEDKFIRTSGKNLIPNSATNQTFNNVQITINEDKSITLNGTASSAGGITIYDNYNYKLNGTYTLSTKVVGTIIHGTAGDYATMSTVLRDYSYNNIIVNAYVGSNSTKVETQTLNATCKNILLYMFEGATFNNTTIYLQLEKGSTATTYEPYGSNEWYIKKNIGKVVLDGTEGWTYTSNSSYPFRLTFTNAIFTTSSNISPNVLCNYYSPFAWNIGTKPDYGTTATVDNPQIITFRNINITSKADWLTWLSNNNTTLYYPLATPTYTQITGTLETQLENVYQKLLSYTGTTNISQVNNDLPFIMNVSAIEV